VKGMKRPARRRSLRWQVTLAVATILALLAVACSSDETSDSPDDLSQADPGDCTVVDMAVSSEKIELLSELASEFNATKGAEADGGCVFVRPQKKASGGAMQLLAEGWGTDEAIQEIEGPPPVVWSPAASTWGPVLNERLAAQGEDPMAVDGTPFMLTPLVIAMPEPMAETLGWPDEPIGWSDILSLANSTDGWAGLGHPEWGPFRLGKTNPNFSTSGLAALIAQSYAATGTTSDLSLEDLANPDVIQFARDIESAVVHYGDTTLTFLNNWYEADQRGTALLYASAAAVEEKSIIDYNLGNPDGELDPGEEPRPPRTKLVAVYPAEGTLFSDNPFYVLDAPWVDERQATGARLFESFVQQPENQEKVLEFGFRPGNIEVPIGAPIAADNGVNPEEPQTLLEVPDADVMAALLDFWDENRKGAQVMLVIDVSGSMGEIADPETRDTKLDLAKRAAIESLGQFKADDLVGLRIFTTGLGAEEENYLDIVPVGPLSEQRDDLESAIGDLVPLDGTPLYVVTEQSFTALVDTYDPARINAVVLLTDGVNDDGRAGDDNQQFDDMITTLTAETESEVGRPVRVFPIAYGADADLATLEQIAAATTAAAYDASDPRSISKVFAAVVSNF
jgi:Ca-activated chloride channel family protein